MCINVTVGVLEHKRNQTLMHFRDTSSILRKPVSENHLGEARHPSHRFLDDPRRELKQRANLHTPVGVACRSRDEVDGIPERSCLAQGPRRHRARWAHRREHQQPDPHTNVLLGAEINQRLSSGSRSSGP